MIRPTAPTASTAGARDALRETTGGCGEEAVGIDVGVGGGSGAGGGGGADDVGSDRGSSDGGGAGALPAAGPLMAGVSIGRPFARQKSSRF